MYTIEFYTRKEWKLRKFLPVYVKQYYWRARYQQGAINNIVADGGEGYWNQKDCQDAFTNFKEAKNYRIVNL